MSAAHAEAPGLLNGQALTEQRWLSIGRTFGMERNGLAHRRSQQMWAVGDWLVLGEDTVYRNRKRAAVRVRAAELTGYAQRTLAMAASVSRKVSRRVRVDGLSWWHHLAVAKLDEDDQIAWLTRAAEESWTVPRLRSELGKLGLTKRRRGPDPVRNLLTALVRLRREDLPGEMVVELWAWWERELGPVSAPGEVVVPEQWTG